MFHILRAIRIVRLQYLISMLIKAYKNWYCNPCSRQLSYFVSFKSSSNWKKNSNYYLKRFAMNSDSSQTIVPNILRPFKRSNHISTKVIIENPGKQSKGVIFEEKSINHSKAETYSEINGIIDDRSDPIKIRGKCNKKRKT